MKISDAAVEAVAIPLASKAMPAGAATGVVGWLMSANWIGWAGVLIALSGLLVSLYFQRRRDKREQAEHVARMARITRGTNDTNT